MTTLTTSRSFVVGEIPYRRYASAICGERSQGQSRPKATATKQGDDWTDIVGRAKRGNNFRMHIWSLQSSTGRVRGSLEDSGKELTTGQDLHDLTTLVGQDRLWKLDAKFTHDGSVYESIFKLRIAIEQLLVQMRGVLDSAEHCNVDGVGSGEVLEVERLEQHLSGSQAGAARVCRVGRRG